MSNTHLRTLINKFNTSITFKWAAQKGNKQIRGSGEEKRNDHYNLTLTMLSLSRIYNNSMDFIIEREKKTKTLSR